MFIWIAAATAAAVITLIVASALFRTGQAARRKAECDLEIYKSQYRELERDIQRGLIQHEDTRHLEVEISRRILAADQLVRSGESWKRAPNLATVLACSLVAMLMIAGVLLLYAMIGRPDLGDLPLQKRLDDSAEIRASRPGQYEAFARLPELPKPAIDPVYADLLARLRTAVADNPDDLRGHELLAEHERSTGDFSAAAEAMTTVIALKGEGAALEDYLLLAENMILAVRGYVSPEAETALQKVLEFDPLNVDAAYYLGHLQFQVGRFDLAYATWATLRERAGPHASFADQLEPLVRDAAFLAGIRIEQVESPLVTLDTEDIELATELTPTERTDMIRNMVEGLRSRIDNVGGSAEEWSQLIVSLAVLGQDRDALRYYADGLNEFAGNTTAEDLLRMAASNAGLLR